MKKIGILTITPNIGFGGNLQAYALQELLMSLTGFRVEIINYRRRILFRERFLYFVHFLRCVLKGRFAKFSQRAELRYRCRNILPFHRDSLVFSKRVFVGKSFRNYVNANYDYVVVGSDQVWRPKYVASIYDYFLMGIRPGIQKIAYAASLGVDEWEYSPRQTAVCRQLLQEFSYVSVRELSAVSLIKRELGYQGSVWCDLDPTMVVDSQVYDRLVIPNRYRRPYMFSYILDSTEGAVAFKKTAESLMGLDVVEFNTAAEDSAKPLKQRVAPPITEWVSGIYHSDFVITDSFHGCVFSIIFNKPFMVYVNERRGGARFHSLLSLFKLESRIYAFDTIKSSKVMLQPIDWVSVNDIIRRKRHEITGRLKAFFNNDTL